LPCALALEDTTDGHQTRIRLVHVLLLPDLLALELHALVEAVEAHVLLVVADNLAAGNGPAVVKLLVYEVTVLREKAVRVRVAAVVVDGVEDVVGELELLDVDFAALGFCGAGGAVEEA
jgi:hypothetical protein